MNSPYNKNDTHDFKNALKRIEIIFDMTEKNNFPPSLQKEQIIQDTLESLELIKKILLKKLSNDQ